MYNLFWNRCLVTARSSFRTRQICNATPYRFSQFEGGTTEPGHYTRSLFKVEQPFAICTLDYLIGNHPPGQRFVNCSGSILGRLRLRALRDSLVITYNPRSEQSDRHTHRIVSGGERKSLFKPVLNFPVACSLWRPTLFRSDIVALHLIATTLLARRVI